MYKLQNDSEKDKVYPEKLSRTLMVHSDQSTNKNTMAIQHLSDIHDQESSHNHNRSVSFSEIQNDSLFKNLFSFGSMSLAVIYMANTMVVPTMDQLYLEISFQTMGTMIWTMAQYWALLLTICIPSYLAIKLSEEFGCPMFAIRVQQVMTSSIIFNTYVGIKYTLQAFHIFQSLCQYYSISNYFIVCRDHGNLGHTTSLQPFQLIHIHSLRLSLALQLGLLFSVYRLSYFENFHQIQKRLLFTFVGKWIISILIISLIAIHKTCDDTYVQPVANIYDQHSSGFNSIMFYLLNIFSCLSFPFVEIYYIKRELRQSSGYSKVQKCYQYQIFMRGLFFFVQMTSFAYIYSIGQGAALNCYYGLDVSILMALLLILTVMSAIPIYGFNFTLNLQILQNTALTATKEDNEIGRQSIYCLSAFICILMAVLSMLMRQLTPNFAIIMATIQKGYISFMVLCFGFSCVCLPVYIYMRTRILLGEVGSRGDKILRVLSTVYFSLSIGFFLLLCASPWIELMNQLDEN